MATVIHVKVIGGEELLGTLSDNEFEGYLTLKNVRALMAQPMGQGQVGLGMLPYLMGNPDAEVKIRSDMIIGEPVNGPPKALEDSYLEQISGLTFATQGTGKIQI